MALIYIRYSLFWKQWTLKYIEVVSVIQFKMILDFNKRIYISVENESKPGKQKKGEQLVDIDEKHMGVRQFNFLQA